MTAFEQIKATAQQIALDVYRSGVNGSQAADLIWAASVARVAGSRDRISSYSVRPATFSFLEVFGSLSARAALDVVAEATQRDEALVDRAAERLEEFTPLWEELSEENLDDEIGLDDDGLDEYYKTLAVFICDELAQRAFARWHEIMRANI